MKILIREEQFIKLLNEDTVGLINRDDITLNDLWYGFETFKHGYMQSQDNSPLLQIQQKLYDKFPEYAEEIKFKPDNDFGDKTSKMVGKLYDTNFKDLSKRTGLKIEYAPTTHKAGLKKKSVFAKTPMFFSDITILNIEKYFKYFYIFF